MSQILILAPTKPALSCLFKAVMCLFIFFSPGVWGSAFTILIKRLVMEGGRKDIVEIMRDAQKEANMEGETLDNDVLSLLNSLSTTTNLY